MKKISENEENEMYRILSEAINSLCQTKPDNAIENLAKKLLEISGQHPDLVKMFNQKKTKEAKNTDTEILITNFDSKYRKTFNSRKFKEEYLITNKIGLGSNGHVFEVSEIKNQNIKYIAKFISKKDKPIKLLSDSTIHHIMSLDHPNISKIHDIIDEKDTLYIIEEFCEEFDLFKFMSKNKEIIGKEDFVKKVLLQLLSALNYLHEKNIVHRDIKPENILVATAKPLNVKLSDFAASGYYVKNKEYCEIIGSPLYYSPEIIQGNSDEKCDLWSVGVVAYNLLYSKSPFNGPDYEILYQIVYKDIHFPNHNISKESADFVSKLLCKSSTVRLSAKEALNHSWFSSENNKNIDPDIILESLENMSNFLQGNNLRKTVLSYILTRKMYEDRNDELTKLFQSIDKDRNGFIDEAEFFECYGNYFPGTPEEQMSQIRQVIESVDINHTKKIDYTEFLIMSNKLDRSLSKKKMEEVFGYFDVDKDNFIDANDLKNTFGEKMTNARYQAMIDEFDKNGDRKLSLEEFIEMLTKFY